MNAHKRVRARKCRHCGEGRMTNAKGIQDHEDFCTGKRRIIAPEIIIPSFKDSDKELTKIARRVMVGGK